MSNLGLRISILILVFPLAACGSLFGGEGHGPPRGGERQDFHPPVDILRAYDANHDGSVTRAEMEAGLRADFAKADTNHDGALDKDEVRAVNAARWNSDASTASPLVDWNHDGVVDFDEFAATARSLFMQLDTNGDGVLSPDEIHPQGTGPVRQNGRMRGGRNRPGGGDDGGGGP